jgi:hypothetical protein
VQGLSEPSGWPTGWPSSTPHASPRGHEAHDAPDDAIWNATNDGHAYPPYLDIIAYGLLAFATTGIGSAAS